MTGVPPRLRFGSCFYAPTGYGTAARAYLHALHGAGVDLTLENLSRNKKPFVPDALVQSLMQRPLDARLCLWHTEPNALASESDPLPRTIVLSTWEADALPEKYRRALNRAHEVWVPSSFNLKVFREQLTVPVVRIPHPVPFFSAASESVEELSQRLNLKSSDFVVFANATWQERKNLDGVIEAFLRAFPDDPDCILILKTRFSFVTEEAAGVQITRAIDRAGLCQGIEKRIRVCTGIWPEGRITALSRRADCYLSLHRGEGWCYPLFDAAVSGTPVIATGYSGPMDYLDPRFHHLVRYEMTAPKEKHVSGVLIFDETMHWAEPDVDHAAQLLRGIHENREAALKMAALGAQQLAIKYSLRAVGAMARKRLDDLLVEVGD